jgi:hypothetical protein
MKHLEYIGQPEWDKQIEYLKIKVRSKVEHSFYIVKRLFDYRKVVYRGLAKNQARLYMLFCSGFSVALGMVADRRQSFGACLIGAVCPDARKRAKADGECRGTGAIPVIFSIKQPKPSLFLVAKPVQRSCTLSACKKLVTYCLISASQSKTALCGLRNLDNSEF